MSKIEFSYIDYNGETNTLFENLKNYSTSKNLIITEDGMAKKFFFSYINGKKMRVFNNILSFDEFLNNIFFSEKYILKDIKRFLSFYSCLSAEIKENLNIKSYYDCIEIADDFFEFFTYIEDKKSLKNLNLSKWQEEKIEVFYQIKIDFDKFLDENSYMPLDWLYKKENLDLFYLKQYEQIIFYDIVDFPYNFVEILNEISKFLEVKIVLQMKKTDFDIENLKIRDVSFEDRKIDLSLSNYKNDFELYNIVQDLQEDKKIKNLQIYSANINFEDKYSIFAETNKYIFNDTKLYKILESYVNILEIIDIKDRTIDLFRLKENLFKASFMEFYGLDVEDYKTFEEILSDDYRYISLDLLQKGKFDKYFSENFNLLEKLKIVLENIENIEKIKNIKDLNMFFREKIFSNEENIKYFIENKYTSIFDKFYEILGILNSNENMMYFNSFEKFFEKNLGRNIFILFFNYLNNITLYGTGVENQNKVTLKDLKSAKFFEYTNKEIVLIHTDNLTLPKIKKNFSLFTEQQKIKLKIKTAEDLVLIEKYRFFQNLMNFSKIAIFSLVDLDNNIDYSAFVYEFSNKYGFNEVKKEIDFKEKLYSEIIDVERKNIGEFRAYKKLTSDFKAGELRIGAYDYIALKEQETFFFLSKLCGIETTDEKEEINGISASLLGKILHKSMEDIFKSKWKNILENPKNILVTPDEILEILEKNVAKENLKVEKFIAYYVSDVLIQRFKNNIVKFLELIYNEIKYDKLLRIEAEKSAKKEVPFLEENGVKVILTGRADLVIETNRARYIIDLKTGEANKEQLKFYAVMFYGNDDSLPVYSFSYNFWNENEIKNFKIAEFKIESIASIKEEMKALFIKFLQGSVYELPKPSKLKENFADFKLYYKYKHLCPLEKMGDEK